MTFEARLAFLVLFFLIWSIAGLIPWAIAAIVTRGRGAALALPLAMAGACAFGVLVPAVGLRDFGGFVLSLLTALVGGALGSVGGIAVWRRLDAGREAVETRVPPLGRR